MTTRIRIAVAAQVALMLVGLVSPLAVKTFGTTVYLETAPFDPRALFRGDYVTLGYTAGENILSDRLAARALEEFRPVYVTLTNERPTRFVAASLERPELSEGQVCLTGQIRLAGTQRSVDFPQIAQYFVTEGAGHAIENQLGEGLLAEVRVDRRCNAVLLGLEPR